MALFNGFTFDGVNSLDYGIYITGEGVYNAPERAVEMVEIQGRNGALAIDQGRWDNIEVTYHCGCFGADQADFAERIGRFRNAICSRTSYCHLTDDYHPDEYRLALCHAGVESDHVRRAGEFDIIFDCKPQRFLTSGEDTITVGDWGDVTEYSGDIVSFEGDEMTAVKSLSISLSPVQNLNGYDHPWVGGAGKNKLSYTEKTQTISGVTFTINSDGTVSTSGTASSSAFFVYSKPSLASGEYKFYSSHGASPKFRPYVYNATKDESINANIPFTVDAGDDVTVYLQAYSGQSTTGEVVTMMIAQSSVTDTTWEPYSNICPISGWDGVEVYARGVNQWDEEWENGYYSRNTGAKAGDTNTRYFRSKNYIACLSNTQYYVKLPSVHASNTAYFAVLFYDSQQNYISAILPSGYGTPVFITPQNAKYMTFYCEVGTLDSSYQNDISFNYPATETAYHAYDGETITQEFVDSQGNTLTVYGGEDEIVGGVLKVPTHFAEFDGSADESWNYEVTFAGLGNFYIRMPSTVATAQAVSSGLICNMAEASSLVRSEPNKCFISIARNFNIAIADATGISNVADFKTWLASHPIQVVCNLATPITYSLTPQQVETLIGTNNIWSDAGEVTVEIADDPNKIVNPTLYDAKPLIKVSGYGTVQVGSVTITIEGSASDVTYIDCDSMECYRLNGLSIVSANSAVSFSSYDFPVLEADSITGVTYSTNVSQVQIVPRWWQL